MYFDDNNEVNQYSVKDIDVSMVSDFVKNNLVNGDFVTTLSDGRVIMATDIMISKSGEWYHMNRESLEDDDKYFRSFNDGHVPSENEVLFIINSYQLACDVIVKYFPDEVECRFRNETEDHQNVFRFYWNNNLFSIIPKGKGLIQPFLFCQNWLS